MNLLVQILKTMKNIVISCHMFTLIQVLLGLLQMPRETNSIVLLLEVFNGLNALKNLNIVRVIVMNMINVVIVLYLIGAILIQTVKTCRNAKDLVNSVLINYHLIVSKKDVTICVLVIVKLYRIVLIKKLMELGIQQYVKK